MTNFQAGALCAVFFMLLFWAAEVKHAQDDTNRMRRYRGKRRKM